VVAEDSMVTEPETVPRSGRLPSVWLTESPESVEVTRTGADATSTVDVAFPG